jgi:hypothetical protein
MIDRSPCPTAQSTGNRYLLSLRVHALEVRIIVVPLSSVGATLGGTGTGHAAHQQPRTGAYTGTIAPSKRRTGKGSNHGTERSATNTSIDRRLVSICASHLIMGILATLGIVAAKLIKTLTGSGQGHHTGASRHGGASGEQ